MAAVWVARVQGKHGFEKLVAIKTILAELAGDEQFRQMFLDEARIASAIEHPNVARILDLGEVGSVLYLAMEWIDGDSVNVLQRHAAKANTPIPLSVALRIAADVCAGLHAAHELRDAAGEPLGVIHRDVSPQNVLIVNGVSKVIDFGIAKARHRTADATTVGEVKGKVQYMAPEQALGVDLDRRADVFAAGAMLYQLVSGRTPFDSSSQLASLHLLCSDKPAPPLDASVPEPIRAAIFGALEKNVDKRTATCADLQRAIEDAAMATGQVATTNTVADFVNEVLSARAAKRKRSVELALSAASERKKLLESVPGIDDSGSLRRLEALAGIHLSPIAPHTQALRSVQPERPSRADRRSLAPLAIVSVAVVAIVALLALRRPSTSPSVQSAPSATAPSSPPSSPAAALASTAAPPPSSTTSASGTVTVAGTAAVKPSGGPAAPEPSTSAKKKKRPHFDDGF